MSPGPFTLQTRGYARAFVNTLDNKADVHGTSYWLEKTPMHLHHISLIERHVPDAQFIHLVRGGRDVVASMHKVTHEHPEVWGGKRSIEDCLDRWIGDIERTRRHAGKSGHHVVRYQDVATSPNDTLRLLCSNLGISHAENMIEEYHAEGEAVSRGAGEWKRPTENIQYKGHKKFESYFEERQKKRLKNKYLDINWIA